MNCPAHRQPVIVAGARSGRIERDRPTVTGTVFNVQRFSIHDGPGIRTTVFLAGCPLACPWCHNPEALAEDHPDHREVTVDELLAEAARDRPFFARTGGGITFSGGEPLAQGDFLLACLDGCRERGLHAAIDTSGSAEPHLMRAAAARADLLLYDLKLADQERHEELTGAPLAPILANLRELDAAGRAIWLRMPLIPGVNDGSRELDALGELAAGLRHARRLHLLPFHGTAAAKYHRLGREWAHEGQPTQTPEQLAAAAARLRRHGLDVVIGG